MSLQEVDLTGICLPEGVRVGSGGSEVKAGFWASLVGVYGNHDDGHSDSIGAACNLEVGLSTAESRRGRESILALNRSYSMLISNDICPAPCEHSIFIEHDPSPPDRWQGRSAWRPENRPTPACRYSLCGGHRSCKTVGCKDWDRDFQLTDAP